MYYALVKASYMLVSVGPVEAQFFSEPCNYSPYFSLMLNLFSSRLCTLQKNRPYERYSK